MSVCVFRKLIFFLKMPVGTITVDAHIYVCEQRQEYRANVRREFV